MALRVSRDVEASASTVWDIITDIDHTAETLSSVERVERLDDGDGFGIGTRWRETRTMFGRQATEEMEVTEVQSGAGYTVISDSGRTRYTSVLTVEPLPDDRARLSMTFGATTSGVIGTLVGATLGRLFQGATRRMLEQDLADLADAAEADHSA
jgi:carbon monoxide dehydrogenase subunit G